MLSPKFKNNGLTKLIKRAIQLSSDRTSLVSWLFLVGSLIFLTDGFLEKNENISIHALLHLTASVLFTIGSALFIPQGENN